MLILMSSLEDQSSRKWYGPSVPLPLTTTASSSIFGHCRKTRNRRVAVQLLLMAQSSCPRQSMRSLLSIPSNFGFGTRSRRLVGGRLRKRKNLCKASISRAVTIGLHLPRPANYPTTYRLIQMEPTKMRAGPVGETGSAQEALLRN